MKTDNSNIVHESFEDYLIKNPYQDTRSFTKEDWELNMYEKWSEENGMNTIINADSNIVVQESLPHPEDYFQNNKRTFTGVNGGDYLDKEDFIHYANWQKEQLQPLLDSHAELLNIANEYFHHLSGLFYENKLNDNGKEFRNTVLAAIEKANNINH